MGRLRPRGEAAGDGNRDSEDAAVPCGAGRGPARDALHLLFPVPRHPELLAARQAQAGHLCGREARPLRPGNYDAAGPHFASVQCFPDRRAAGSDYGRSVRPPRSNRISAPFLSHPRARASLLLATSNNLSPNIDILSVCDVSRHAHARTHTRLRAKPNIDRASVCAEVEMHRHVFKPNERPRLQLLALRYGVAVEDIRAANELQDPSAPVGKKNYLYIPCRRRVVDV